MKKLNIFNFVLIILILATFTNAAVIIPTYNCLDDLGEYPADGEDGSVIELDIWNGTPGISIIGRTPNQKGEGAWSIANGVGVLKGDGRMEYKKDTDGVTIIKTTGADIPHTFQWYPCFNMTADGIGDNQWIQFKTNNGGTFDQRIRIDDTSPYNIYIENNTQNNLIQIGNAELNKEICFRITFTPAAKNLYTVEMNGTLIEHTFLGYSELQYVDSLRLLCGRADPICYTQAHLVLNGTAICAGGGDSVPPTINFTHPTQNQRFNLYDGWLNLTTNENANCTTNETDWVFDAGESNATRFAFFNTNGPTLTDGDYTVNVSCWDSTSNNDTTTLSFSIDQILPLITILSGNSFDVLNQSEINQYLNPFTFNISFSDESDLFAYGINVTRAGIVQYNITNETITENNITVTIFLNTTDWTPGLQNIELLDSDAHTRNKIKPYEIENFLNKIRFKTSEKNEIEITSDGAYRTGYLKYKDRYSFDFDYLFSSTTRTFKIKTNNKIYPMYYSDYNAHFVVWNPSTKSGNWIDFEGVPGNYTIVKKNDKYYEVTFEGMPKVDYINVNSIGGLNIFAVNYSWFKGNFTNSFNSIATVSASESFRMEVAKLSGYVDDVNANFFYNLTERSVVKTPSTNSVLFTSNFFVPGTSGNYSVVWNITITQHNSNEYNFTVNDTQQVFFSILNITVRDEINTSLIFESVTVIMNKNVSVSKTTSGGSVEFPDLAVGEYFITAQSASYPLRTIFFTVTNASAFITFYLLEDATGNADITYIVQDQDANNIQDARLSFQRNINGSFITITQAESDFAGQVQVLQDQANEYRIIVTHDDFPTKSLFLRPINTEYTITLNRIQPSLYDNVWEGIHYTLTPKQRIINVSAAYTDISLDIFSVDSTLEFFGVFLDNHSFTCNPATCLTNISGIPAGGIATVQILGNDTGTFDVHYFFKRSGFDLQYIHGSLYSFQLLNLIIGENMANIFIRFRDQFDSPIMLAGIAAILVIAACVVGSQLGIPGLGLVFIAVIGNFIFTIAGYIDTFIGIVISIVGIMIFLVLVRLE